MKYLIFIFSLLFVLPLYADKNNKLSIYRMTPAGQDVSVSTRQIVFNFNRPVVRLGDMSRKSADIPIIITPAVKCQWRWLDVKSLSCQLDKKHSLKKSTNYKVFVKSEIKTSDGVVLDKSYEFEFITTLPKINYTNVEDWLSPTKPVLSLRFNQPVTKTSVLQAIKLKTLNKKIYPIKIYKEKDSENDLLQRYMQLKKGDKFLQARNIKTPFNTIYDEARYKWMISPVDDLPANAVIKVMEYSGLKSIEGDQIGIRKPAIVVKKITTYPEFKFVGFVCYNLVQRKNIIIKNTITTNNNNDGTKIMDNKISQCDPQSNFKLVFSSPVTSSSLQKSLKISPSIERKNIDIWENYSSNWYSKSHKKNKTYTKSLPDYFKAYQKYTITSNDNNKFTDVFGRALKNPINIKLYTSHKDKQMSLNNNDIVLEKNINSAMPLFVTNLDEIKIDYYSLTKQGLKHNQTYNKILPKVVDKTFATSLDVRKMLDNKSGMIVGYLNSEPQIHDYKRKYHKFVAQITPYQVHMKIGHFNSTVWVTDMATGKPVADAKISLYPDTFYNNVIKDQPDLLTPQVITDKNGLATMPGIQNFDPDLKISNTNRKNPHFFVRVDKNDDMAILPLSYSYEVSTYGSGVWSYTQKKGQYARAWGYTAQGVYKLGDKVQYKLYVRDQNNFHWIAPDIKDDYSLEVTDSKDTTVHKIAKLKLSEFGGFAGEFVVPTTASMGWYDFTLKNLKTNKTHYPIRVLVSDFTPAPFKVMTDLNGKVFKADSMLVIKTAATMFAGGPFADAKTRLNAIIKPIKFSSKNPAIKDFSFYNPVAQEDKTIHSSENKLDNQGELNRSLLLDEENITYGNLIVESAVADDRGKFIAKTAKALYQGRDRFIGLKQDQWAYEKNKPASVDFIVVDANGNPIADIPVEIKITRESIKSAKVKSAGNVYVNKYITEWIDSGSCNLISKNIALKCEWTPPEAGYYKITAMIKDSKNRKNISEDNSWVTGAGFVNWTQNNNNNLKLVLDKEQYKIGDTAQVLIKNPYPGATALISIERYGVLRKWTQILNDSLSIIDIPIKKDDYPGVYLSVVLTSPRVEKPFGKNNIDLGKPAFKMGYIAIPVNDIHKQIDLKIFTDKQVYKPREKVKATIEIEPKYNDKNEPIEIAVVAIDEAVFALNKSGKKYYNPYQGFNSLEELGVKNYNLLKKLIGRYNFETKGATPGGGGGESDMNVKLRNLIKYIGYWNPSIKLKKGEKKTKIEFKVPDNLTGWRLFALAVTKDDQMGLGQGNFKVNRATEIRPIMPNQITQGDKFKAGFSIINRTDKNRTLQIKVKVAGSAIDTDAPLEKTYTIKTTAYERAKIYLDIQSKKAGEMAFLITAGDEVDTDAFEHHLSVKKRRSLITATNFGTTTDKKIIEKIAFPQDIYPDVGGITVNMSPSVISNLDGAFEYMKNYPYTCWEQRISKAVMASQYNKLKKYSDKDIWVDNLPLVEKTLNQAVNSQAPNGGFTYWIPQDKYVSPYLSAYTALAFIWLKKEGFDVPTLIENRLLSYLEGVLKNYKSSKNNQNLSSSIQAIILNVLSQHNKLTLKEFNRYKNIYKTADLFSKTQFLTALNKVSDDEKLKSDTLNSILSHMSQSAGMISFNDKSLSSYEMLSTPMRANCVTLSAFLNLKNNPKLFDKIKDIPMRQVRSITQKRGKKNHWQNTQENVFCMNALLDYSKVYESVEPKMQITALVGDNKIGQTNFNALNDKPSIFYDKATGDTPGQKTDVTINKKGEGRLYYSTKIAYAPTDAIEKRINNGIEIRREYSIQQNDKWVKLTNPITIKRGDIVKVDLYLSTPTDRYYVVVDDPVPGGLEPVNKNLATSSAIDADSATNNSYHFYHQELRFNAARFFADYLPKGEYNLSYTAQAIATGQFTIMPIHSEQMYETDIFGKGLSATLNVND
ncbi:MAG: large extracellular alpha-helical protein [Gammaproteobacteria bacterium]|nr:MAG: large extracellular alpha-helical protein [Gammaproteobacteria bacterium]